MDNEISASALRKESLIDAPLETLSFEQLSMFQASLIAKLILVNDELRNRYTTIVGLSEKLESDHARQVLEKGAARMDALNEVLRDELSRIMGRPK